MMTSLKAGNFITLSPPHLVTWMSFALLYLQSYISARLQVGPEDLLELQVFSRLHRPVPRAENWHFGRWTLRHCTQLCCLSSPGTIPNSPGVSPPGYGNPMTPIPCQWLEWPGNPISSPGVNLLLHYNQWKSHSKQTHWNKWGFSGLSLHRTA